MQYDKKALRNGPGKNDSNNGNEHVANFSIVCTYFWLA